MTDVAATDAIKIPNVIRARKKVKDSQRKTNKRKRGIFQWF